MKSLSKPVVVIYEFEGKAICFQPQVVDTIGETVIWEGRDYIYRGHANNAAVKMWRTLSGIPQPPRIRRKPRPEPWQNHCREYRIWRNLISRCHNPACPSWRFYGAKGVKCCNEWLADFWTFYREVGPIPAPLSIDRIDPAGDYTAANVRLATAKEQAANKRPKADTQ